MEIPNILKGFLYPSERVSRCPSFHSCKVYKKCQNYDRHNHICVLCESRCRPPINLGGMLAEGEYQPDIQHAHKIMEEAMLAPFSHPDQQAQEIRPHEITNKMRKEREAVEKMAAQAEMANLSLEEQVVNVQVDPKYLGRI